MRIRTNDRAFVAPAGALTADSASASNEAAPIGENALAPVIADAKRAWIQSGADPSAFDGVRITTADLSGTRLGQTVGKTIYIDIDAAGHGWGAGGVDLFEVIEHELGHVLGYAHSDAAEHAAMSATLHVFAAPSTIATSGWLASPTALLASNSPAPASVITQALASRAQPQLAAPAASLISALSAPSKARASGVVALMPSLLLRGIAPARASLIGLTSGRVFGFDTCLSHWL